MSGLDTTVQPSHHFDMGMVRTTCGVCDTSGSVEVYRRHRWSTQMTSNILCVMLGWIKFSVQKVSWCVKRLTGTRRFGVEEPFWEHTGCSPGRFDLKQRIRRWRKSICRRDEARSRQNSMRFNEAWNNSCATLGVKLVCHVHFETPQNARRDKAVDVAVGWCRS